MFRQLLNERVNLPNHKFALPKAGADDCELNTIMFDREPEQFACCGMILA